MKRKIVFAIVGVSFFSSLCLASVRSAYAADPRLVWGVLTGKEKDISTFSSALLQGANDAVMRVAVGKTTDEVVKDDGKLAVGVMGSDGTLGGGAAGYLALAGRGLDGIIQNPPISVKYYAYDLASKLPGNLVSPPSAYAMDFNPFTLFTDFQAQAVDFFFKSTVLRLWQVTRNIAYSVIVLLLVIVGFMIMFKKKIAPQVVVSVTNALPRLVMGVILITFSYPIAALTIPIMAALNHLVFTAIQTAGVTSGAEGTLFGGLSQMFEWFIMNIFERGVVGAVTGIGINLFTGFLLLAMVIITLVVGAGIVFTAVSRVAKIIIATVFGPLILALGIIPGNETLTSDWFKGLIINTVSVPAMIAVYYFGFSFIAPSSDVMEAIRNADWGTGFTLIAGQFLLWFIAISIMWYARKVPEAIAAALKAPAAWVPGVSPKGKR